MNEQLYLNISYNYHSPKFEYDVDKYKWSDPIPFNCRPYFQTSDKYKLKIWLDLNDLKLHKRIIISDLNFDLRLRSYSLIKK